MPISVVSAYFKGLGLALKHPFLILLKWSLNLAFAAVLTRPLFRFLAQDLDHSQTGRDLWTGLDLSYLLETLYRTEPGRSDYILFALLAGLAFAWLNLYLTGGILHGLQQKRHVSPKFLVEACSNLLRPMLTNLVCCAVLLLAVVLIPLALWGVFLENKFATFPNTLFQLNTYWVGVIFIVLVLFTWVARVHDFSRVLICKNAAGDTGYFGLLGGIRAFLKAMGFTTRYFVSSWFLWLLFFATQALLAGLFIYSFQSTAIEGPQWFWWELMLGQLLVLGRIGCWLGGLGGAAVFLNSRLDLQRETPAPQSKPEAVEAAPVITNEEHPAAEDEASIAEREPGQKGHDDTEASEESQDAAVDPDAVYLQKGRETLAK